MSPSSLAREHSPHRLAAELATPRPCLMVVVTEVDGTLRDPRLGYLTPAGPAPSSLASPVLRWLSLPRNDIVVMSP